MMMAICYMIHNPTSEFVRGDYKATEQRTLADRTRSAWGSSEEDEVALVIGLNLTFVIFIFILTAAERYSSRWRCQKVED